MGRVEGKVALITGAGRGQGPSHAVDVRDEEAMVRATADAVAELGRLDVVSANAGVCVAGTWDGLSSEAWRTTVDVNLTGDRRAHLDACQCPDIPWRLSGR